VEKQRWDESLLDSFRQMPVVWDSMANLWPEEEYLLHQSAVALELCPRREHCLHTCQWQRMLPLACPVDRSDKREWRNASN
jgi:hypothetical protein